MRRIYRGACKCPSDWDDQVAKALQDAAEFLRQAIRFEALGINSEARRGGFSRYAPQVLVVSKAGKVGFRAIWGRHKEAIAAMSHRKCAYCEGRINAPRAAHIEHFKPKALFPSLAYEWTNYFLGCPGCNGAKADKWPKVGGYLRPDQGVPSRHFVFAEDGTVTAAVPGSAAIRMIDDFDLKRKWLSDERKQSIGVMLRLLGEVTDAFDAGHEETAKRLARVLLGTISTPGAAYSVAVTQCFWRAWKSACPGVKL